jgi:hypothetical protein
VTANEAAGASFATTASSALAARNGRRRHHEYPLKASRETPDINADEACHFSVYEICKKQRQTSNLRKFANLAIS